MFYLNKRCNYSRQKLSNNLGTTSHNYHIFNYFACGGMIYFKHTISTTEVFYFKSFFIFAARKL